MFSKFVVWSVSRLSWRWVTKHSCSCCPEKPQKRQLWTANEEICILSLFFFILFSCFKNNKNLLCGKYCFPIVNKALCCDRLTVQRIGCFMWDVIEGFLVFQFNFWTRFPFSDISLLNGFFGRQMKGMSRTDLENVPSGVSGCAFSPGAEEPRQKWAAIIYHLSCPLSSRSPEHLSHLPHLRLLACMRWRRSQHLPFTHSPAIQWRCLQGHRTLEPPAGSRWEGHS